MLKCLSAEIIIPNRNLILVGMIYYKFDTDISGDMYVFKLCF